MKSQLFGLEGFLLICGAVGAMAHTAVYAGGEPAASEETPYEVRCESEGGDAQACKVDKETYIGWRTFHSACHQCHAQGAVGSSFAPSLIQRLQGMSHDTFEQRVMNGFQGQVGVMPPFKDNPNVVPRIDALYSYLKARSDGVLPPGKPARLD